MIRSIKKLMKSVKLKSRQCMLYMTEYPLRAVQDRQRTIVREQLIPTALYQTWESNQFGKTHAREIEKFRDLNPEISFKIFTNEKTDQYMKESWSSHPIYQLYLRAVYGPMRADIFRYCIIYERGGYYFDIAKGCNFPLTKLHALGDSGLIAYEPVDCLIYPDVDIIRLLQHPEKYLLQWGFGFSKEHPVLKQVIDNICKHSEFFENLVFDIPKNAILMLTGPGMFTRSFREVIAREPGINVRQAGINFNGFGVFSMPKSETRYLKIPAYQHARNGRIIN